jgi:hypothetical protein
VQINVDPDCLKDAPTGEHGSPFLMEFAVAGAIPKKAKFMTRPTTTKTPTAEPLVFLRI